MKIKRILAVMLAGAMMLSMAACGGESKEESAAQPSAEQKTIDGNVLDAEQYFNGYIGSEPTTLDSVVGNDQYSGSVLTNTMEPLTRLAEKDGKNIREGAGAESWESNEDVPYGPSIFVTTTGATVSLLKHRTMFTPS